MTFRERKFESLAATLKDSRRVPSRFCERSKDVKSNERTTLDCAPQRIITPLLLFFSFVVVVVGAVLVLASLSKRNTENRFARKAG